jgi:phosphoglucosamine mutase
MFGTGGIRGPVGETVGTNLAIRLGRALGTHADSVVVGRDVRESGRMLEHALIAGIEECGSAVIRVGVESTPTIARSVPWLDADLGVAITGSHNPAGDNGFKLWTATGRALSRSQYRSIIRRANAGTVSLAAPDEIGSTTNRTEIREMHRQRLVSEFDSFEGLSVVVDLGNGAGRLTADVLDELGCDVTTLNSHRDGRFPGRGSEPTATACQRLCRTVRAIEADVGIAHDADADRMCAVDETGRFVPGDELFGLFASQVAAGGRRVALTVDTSSVVEDAVRDTGGEIIRTPVGEMSVAAAMDNDQVVFGGEPSGLWIWGDHTRCPDGHFAACKLVEQVRTDGPLSTQLTEFTGRYTTRRQCLDAGAKYDAIDRIRRRLNGDYERVDTTDGIRIETDDGWFLIRASGTEPVVRITAEAVDRERADQLFDRAVALTESVALSV